MYLEWLMPDATHVTAGAHQSRPDRRESETNSQGKPPSEGWRQAAVNATTIGELYDAARAGQAAGDWSWSDTTWCKLLREALGAGDRAALALVRRELGGVEVTS